MVADIKGVTYVPSIGATNRADADNRRVAKPVHSEDEATFWGRLCSAWQSRYKTQATQTAIATRYGISQPSVGDYMRGGLPRMNKAVEIARDLRVCVEWLLTGRGPRLPVGHELTPFYAMLFEMLEQLPESERVRTAENIKFKLDHQGVFPRTIDEAMEFLTDTGKHRKPQ